MLLEILIFVASFPIGYLLAYMTKEELASGRKWFKLIIPLAFIIGLLFIFFKQYYITLTCAFIIILTSISLIKSFDKKWTRKR